MNQQEFDLLAQEFELEVKRRMEKVGLNNFSSASLVTYFNYLKYLGRVWQIDTVLKASKVNGYVYGVDDTLSKIAAKYNLQYTPIRTRLSK